MEESPPMPKPKSTLTVPKDRYFLLGFGLFLLGVTSVFLWLHKSQTRQIDHLISAETLALVQIDLNKKNFNFLQTKLNLTHNSSLSFFNRSNQLTLSRFTPWIGKKAVLSWHPNQQFLHAFSYKSKSQAQNFTQHFLLPQEKLAQQSSSLGTIYTPSYSSKHAFLFYKGWFFWADSPQTLIHQLNNSNKLYKHLPYQKLKKDLPHSDFLSAYFNFAGNTSSLTKLSQNKTYTPILRGVGRSTPQWGLVLNLKNNTLNGDVKVLTHQSVYNKNQVISKAQNRTIPDLAHFAPKNALFFQNGHDLYAKYQHTKQYLNELDPQLSLIFEGLIRAQAETWFGSDVDFETEFLNLIRGPYAFILDFNQGLEIGFISSLKSHQDPEKINQLIQTAQARFTPVTEKVTLPDGTTREELVATDPQNIPITKKNINDQIYYTSQTESGETNFSYTQIGEYLVMTNRVNLVEKIITTYANKQGSLAANQDFRNSVLYDFSNAEVYGFLNAPKLQQLNLYWQQTSGNTGFINHQMFSSLRSLIFSKQVFPDAIFIKLRLFFN